MKPNAHKRSWLISLLLSLYFAIVLAPAANAIPSFFSADQRLPNPDRPYEMTSETAHYGNSLFALYDLSFQVADRSQLQYSTLREDGRLEFDSTFNVNYTAVISQGLAPPHPVSGTGIARATGITRTPTNSFSDFAYFKPQVFDTELVSLNLFGLSPIPEVMFRESPTLRSTGVTIRENICPVCASAPASAAMFWNIWSFFDAYTEYSISGGVTWHPADKLIHVEQAPEGFPPGDYNQNKKVDADDYEVWRSTIGLTGAGLAADGNWSGEVDTGDYIVWKANVGTAVGGSGAAVPEPVALSLLILAMPAMFLRYRAH